MLPDAYTAIMEMPSYVKYANHVDMPTYDGSMTATSNQVRSPGTCHEPQA